jgi:hypothetical protein
VPFLLVRFLWASKENEQGIWKEFKYFFSSKAEIINRQNKIEVKKNIYS